MVPHVAFERSDVEIADDQGRFAETLRPSRHPSDEVELLAELGVDRPVRDVAPGRHIDVLEPNSARQADADMPRFAIVLPVVASRRLQLDPAEDGDSVVHALAVELLVDVAEPGEMRRREDVIVGLGFLQAKDVGLLLGDQALDDRQPRADRVDVPGYDLDGAVHGQAL